MENKVLVVEDDATLLETLEYNLARQGYQVLTASDGLKTLEMARQKRPNISHELRTPLAGLKALRSAPGPGRRRTRPASGRQPGA